MTEVAELRKTLGIGKVPEMVPPAIQIPILQSWDEMLNKLKDLSSATVKENIELTRRVSQLEEELQVWKQARSVIVDNADREKKQHEDEKLALQKRIGVLESMQAQDSMVLCVLDGDGNIFADDLLKAGLEGGREAARNLTSGLKDYLKRKGYDGLQETLVRSEVCTADQFEAFLVGISQASPRFLLIDVGYGKEAADAKIKEYLQTYTRFPQTLKVFFGGGHDNGYLPTLTALENERLLNKIILLTGYREIATELKALNLQALTLEGLFRGTKLPTSSGSRPGTSPPMSISEVTGFPPGLKPNLTPPNVSSMLFNNNSKQNTRKPIDPNLPLTKQNPPPCNEYYLLGRCPRNENCRYYHDYELTEEQIAQLRKHAKNGACPSVKLGVQCSFGARCIWGHTCPRGPTCYHFRQGKCWFKTAAAHTGKETNGESIPSPLQQQSSLEAATSSILGSINGLNLNID